jgi:hypothetical protein
VSEGGLPSASQREAMDRKLPPEGVLTAVMIDSLIARGVSSSKRASGRFLIRRAGLAWI